MAFKIWIDMSEIKKLRDDINKLTKQHPKYGDEVELISVNPVGFDSVEFTDVTEEFINA